MCVIIRKPSGVPFPPKDYLKKCWARNDHGAGIVAVNGGHPLFFQKGIMKEEEFLDIVEKIPVEQDVVMHLRINSRGGVSPELTHPFEFSRNNQKRFFFHNGTIRPLTPPTGKSDSSFFTELLSVVSDETVESLIKKQESYGRFVTVSQKQDSEEYEVTVYPDKESKEIDGVWYSNTRHETETKKPTIGDGGECGYEHWDWYGTKNGNNVGMNRCTKSTPPPVPESSTQRVIPFLKEKPTKDEMVRALAAAWMSHNPTSPRDILGVITHFGIDKWIPTY